MILLASASASRATLLRNAGVVFEAVSSGVDEAVIKTRLLNAGEGPAAIAETLAEAKALAVSADDRRLVIGADQTLDLDGELVDKASCVEEVRDRLRRLRGRTHLLHSAAVLVRNGAIVWRSLSSPQMTMRAFSDDFLEDYLARQGEAVLSSVGCYHLEGVGAQLFERVEGDQFAVLGLPLIQLLAALRDEAALAQ
jgi:septum formation protein